MVIKKLDMDNPFADYGNIITGKRFVGRKIEVKAIKARVLGSSYGNLAVMGLPRIGKSSLVWNALYENKNEHIKNGIIVDRINMGNIDSMEQFYKILMTKVLVSIRYMNMDIFEILNRIKNSYVEKTDIDEVELFYRLLKEQFRVIYILDEFDNVTRFFRLEDFQFLRELSILPDTKVCFVTISRRTISELESENGAISNFYGIFTDLHLQPFNESDEKCYWKWANELGLEVHDDYKNKVAYFVGKHPFLMDMFNYHVFNCINSSKKLPMEITDEVESILRNDIWSQYDSMLSIINEENLLSPLIQVVIGPLFNVKNRQVERLSKYGLISLVPAKDKYKDTGYELEKYISFQDNDYSYITISHYFCDYLKQREIEFDIWPLWNTTEKLLRIVIIKYLVNRYGENWKEGFLNNNPKQRNNIIQMERIRDDNIKKFGGLASDNLVNYTYPLSIWNVFIVSDWPYFQKILGGKLKDWQEKFILLGKVRNPLAHSNQDFVPEDDITMAKVVCKSIIDKISAWDKSI